MAEHPAVVWLRERLNADEATARDAGPAADGHGLYVHDDDYRYPLHIGRDTLLARVEADRAILELHTGGHECVGSYTLGGERRINPSAYCVDGELCETLELLALTRRHEPGFDPTWTEQP